MKALTNLSGGHSCTESPLLFLSSW